MQNKTLPSYLFIPDRQGTQAITYAEYPYKLNILNYQLPKILNNPMISEMALN